MRARSLIHLFAVSSLAVGLVVGCAVSSDPEANDEGAMTDEAMKKAVCPAAPAVCTHGGRCGTMGSVVCKAGQVCDPGASCPKFNPADPHPCDPVLPHCSAPPAKPSCATVKCTASTHCELKVAPCLVAPCPELPQCVPNGCTKDADCRLFDDYCTGCDCRALLSSEADPVCAGPGVRCLRQPCGGHVARCSAGKCVVR